MTITKEQIMNATGNELDELVALAQGWVAIKNRHGCPEWISKENQYKSMAEHYYPSTSATQCMEIMEREKINLKMQRSGKWLAGDFSDCWATGETIMIAAMRCFCLSKLEVLNEKA